MNKKTLMPLALVTGLVPWAGVQGQEDLDEITVTVVPQEAPAPESVANRIELPEAAAPDRSPGDDGNKGIGKLGNPPDSPHGPPRKRPDISPVDPPGLDP